jgi:hypothetical protein
MAAGWEDLERSFGEKLLWEVAGAREHSKTQASPLASYWTPKYAHPERGHGYFDLTVAV